MKIFPITGSARVTPAGSARTVSAQPARKALAVVLSGVLALGGVPTFARAQDAAELQQEAAATDLEQDAWQAEADEKSHAPAPEKSEIDETQTPQLTSPTDGSAAEDALAASLQVTPTGFDDDLFGDDYWFDDDDGDDATDDTAGNAADDPAAAQSAFTSNSYVSVYTQKDAEGYGNKYAQTVKAGVTLYANVLDYFSDKPTPDDGGFVYQWYAGSNKSSSIASYTPLEGQTSQELVITEELAEQLSGKYLAVSVTSADKTLYGPGDRSGISYSSIPGPVMPEGAVTVGVVHVVEAGTTDVNYRYAADKTIQALAKETRSGDYLDDSLLTYQWQTVEGNAGTDIAGATASTLDLAPYAGKTVRCVVTAKAGGSSRTTSKVTVGAPGAVYVSSVKLDKSGAVDAGATVAARAMASYSSEVSSYEGVTLQWYVAEAATGEGTALAGATSTTFATSADMAGKYLYCVADGGYGSVSSSRVGPVTVKGGYDLASVEVKSSGVAAQAGNVLTPKAKYLKVGTYISYEADVPSDAKVTYVWRVEDADGSNAKELTAADGVSGDGSLTLGSELVGKRVWVEARALMAPATGEKITVLGANEYELHHVMLSPSRGSLTTGQSLKATVYASQLSGSSSVDVTARAGVAVQWYVADSADAAADGWTALENADAATLQIPAEAANRYLKAVAASGSSSVEQVFATAIIDGDSLAGIVQKLDGWAPTLTFGQTSNVNDLLMAHLAELGIDTTGLSAKVSAVDFSVDAPSATRGISVDEADNGAVTFFSADLTKGTVGSSARRVRTLTWTLTRAGEEATFSSKTFQIPWDEDAAQAQLQAAADALAVAYATGDSAQSVTSNVSLQSKAGANNWASVSWSSSAADLKVSGYSWDSALTGSIVRGAADKQVTLTATLRGTSTLSADMPQVLTVAKTFDLTIKADEELAAAEQAAADAAANAFAYDVVTYSSTGDAIEANGLGITADLQLPTPRKLGVNGSQYAVTYRSSDPALSINGYAATVTRGLPGATPKTVEVTCTVTSKTNPEATASKALTFTIAPLEDADLDEAVALMTAARAGYAAAVLNGQDASAVEGGLKAPQKAFFDEKGQLAWSYDYATTNAHRGAKLVELEGSSEASGYYLRRSSDKTVVAHENLNVTTPEWDTEVTVDSVLTDERFASVYELYKDDPTVDPTTLLKLKGLVNQPVSATFTVKGTNGTRPADDATVTTTVGFMGPDESGDLVAWVPATEMSLPVGMTAAEASRLALERYGMTCDAGMWTVSSLAGELPNGQTSLGMVNPEPGKYVYWVLYVNGADPELMASNYVIKPGDKIQWVYTEYGEGLPANEIEVDPDATRPAYEADWAGFKGNESDGVVSAATPTEGAALAWDKPVNLVADGADYANASDPVIVNGDVYIAVDDELRVLDAQTGAVKQSAKLAASIGYTSNLQYCEGLILVPLSGGRMQALTADALKTAWVTDELPKTDGIAQQSLSAVTVRNGYAYFGTTAWGSNKSAGGYLVCLNLNTGAIRWRLATDGAGYNSSAVSLLGEQLVVADDEGMVSLLDPKTGEATATHALGAQVRSGTVVAGDVIYVTSTDGVLHRVELDAKGDLVQTGSVSFAHYSVSTPTFVDGKIVVGGSTSDWRGVVAVIDAQSMAVLNSVTELDDGGLIPASVQASILVSRVGSDVWAYFTSNGYPGSVYGLKLGTGVAVELYRPEDDYQQYSWRSIVADGEGNLYYHNDSGSLFKLAASSGRPQKQETAATPKTKTPAQMQSVVSNVTKLVSLTLTSAAASQKGGRTATSEVAETSQTSDASARATEKGSASAVAAAATARAERKLPIWPLVGMTLAAAAIFVALFARRRSDSNGEEA